MMKQLSWQRFIYGDYAASTARIISLILLIFLGLLIYQTINFIRLRPATTEAFRPLRAAAARLPDIAAWHLFGNYQAQALAAGDVPKTGLDIKLVGLMLATPNRYSQAIIAVPGETEKVYTLGDEIAGGATIYKITADGVILRRDGKLESLRLPGQALQFVPQPAPLQVEQE